MSLLNALPILGRMLYGTTPQFSDPNNPDTVREPGFWENTLNPELAQQEGALKQQRVLMAKRALDTANATDVGNKYLAGQYFDAAPEPIKQLAGSAAGYNAQFGANPTSLAQALPSVSAGEEINLGVPKIKATEQFNRAAAGVEQAKNDANEAAATGALGLPVKRPMFEDQTLDYNTGVIAGKQALLPRQQQLESTNLSNDQFGAEALKERYPILNTIANEKAINDLFAERHIEPERQTLLLRQFQADNGRFPTIKEAQDLAAKNSVTQEKNTAELLPLTHVGDVQANRMRNLVTGQALTDAPNTLFGQHARSVLDAYTSQFENPANRLGPTVRGDSVVKELNPMVPTTSEAMSASMGLDNNGGSGSGRSLTTPSGKTVTAKPMFTAPTGRSTSTVDEVKARARQPLGGSLPAQASASTAVQPPVVQAPTAEDHHGGASAHTDPYDVLVQNAVNAKKQYGVTSPQYAQAIAKVHSAADEERVPMDQHAGYEQNPSLGWSVGTMPSMAARKTGEEFKASYDLYSQLIKALGSGVYNHALHPFYQGLTAPSE